MSRKDICFSIISLSLAMLTAVCIPAGAQERSGEAPTAQDRDEAAEEGRDREKPDEAKPQDKEEAGEAETTAGEEEAAAEKNELRSLTEGLFEPVPDKAPDLEGIAQTPEQVKLGRMLFFERRLSESHTISCNSCHSIGTGGADLMEVSIGHKWQMGPRNSPTVFNAVFNTAQFWDGRAEDLAEQAGGPIENPIEMATTAEQVVAMLKAIPGYKKYFEAAFPDQEDPITFRNIRSALAAFEATLLTPDSPFDRWLKGDDDAMTPRQKKGLRLFVESGCASCHNGVNLGGGMYAPFGVVEKPGAEFLPPDDKGRFEVTRTASDEYVFKVPTLRNVALTPPYFHSGRAWDLGQAMAVMANSQLGIKLGEDEIAAMTDFMRALTGKQPKIVFPILPPPAADTPKPQP